MLIDVPVFTEVECADLAGRLEKLRPSWLTRGHGFATYGVASYLDVMCSDQPDESYYARLRTWNDSLRKEFGKELERVRKVLGEHLRSAMRFEDAVALPGFHVFEEGGVCTRARPSMHFDLQHRSMRWPFTLAGDDVISFTVAIKLPRLGGGLDVWDITEEDLRRLKRMGRRVTMEHLARMKPMRRHDYHVGVMAVQMRPLMHRISAIPQRFDGDQRITLQGHGVREQGGWVLYW